jgi:hypothetical protein
VRADIHHTQADQAIVHLVRFTEFDGIFLDDVNDDRLVEGLSHGTL